MQRKSTINQGIHAISYEKEACYFPREVESIPTFLFRVLLPGVLRYLINNNYILVGFVHSGHTFLAHVMATMCDKGTCAIAILNI